MKKRAIHFLLSLVGLSCLTYLPLDCFQEEHEVSLDPIPADHKADTAGPEYDDLTIDLSVSEGEFESETGVDVKGSSEYNPDDIYTVKVREGQGRAWVDDLPDRAFDNIEHIEESVSYSTQHRAVYGYNRTSHPPFSSSSSSNASFPDDPLYPFQWNFDQINVEEGWQWSRGENVTVAVIDTGVTYQDLDDKNARGVEDLQGTSFVEGYDFVDSSPDVYDPQGHGTHVAGTVAQTTDNAYGVAGVAYESTIMPIRVLDRQGRGSTSYIAKGVRYAVDHNADVINLSLGASVSSNVMHEAVQYAYQNGVTVVAAAGNSGKREPSYPAAHPESIAVAATQYDETTTFYSQKGDFVDVAAPGGNTKVDQNDDGRPDGIMQETVKDGNPSSHQFALYMGTSMASPHVAGIAALLESWGITHPDAIRSYLSSEAYIPGDDDDDAANLNENESYGSGIVQVESTIRSSQTSLGLYRLGLALMLALVLFIATRRSEFLDASVWKTLAFAGTAVFVASGLQWASPILSDIGLWMPQWLHVAVLPFPEWVSVFDPSWHQDPFTCSFLLPLGAILLGHGHRIWKYITTGFGVGIASYAMIEAAMLSSNVVLIPGISVWDQAFLVVNALITLGIVYLSLKPEAMETPWTSDN